MEYRLIKLNSIPTIYFAHSFEVDKYCYQRLADFNHFEISYIEKGDIVRTEDNNLLLDIKEHSVEIIVPGDEFVQECNTTHNHITVGFICDSKLSNIGKQDILERSNALPGSINDLNQIEVVLPKVLLPGEDTVRVHLLLKKLIQTYHVTDICYRQIACMETLFSILYLLTEISHKDALYDSSKMYSPSQILYIQKAKQYIAEHIDDKFTGAEVALELGITQGYLCSIFKAVKGQALVTYINQTKLNKVLELLKIHNITLSQAGEMVGIPDSHYLSRLFRKHYGVSYREYKSNT